MSHFFIVGFFFFTFTNKEKKGEKKTLVGWLELLWRNIERSERWYYIKNDLHKETKKVTCPNDGAPPQ